MKATFTPRAKAWLRKSMMLLLTLLGLMFSKTSSAWHVDVYSTSGCAGETINVHAVIIASETNIYYHWQYKDNSGVWKCFVNGTNNINGTNFTVSGATSTGVGSNPTDLSIANSTTALENVQVRIFMGLGGDPCNSGGSGGNDDNGVPVENGDNSQLTKMWRIHVLSGADCGGTTPGCIGNILSDANGYYGGFESGANNFTATTGQTALTSGTANSTTTGRYMVLNNPYAYLTTFGQFAPHSGNYQMIVNGNSTASTKVWYKTVNVTPGATYSFCVWAAKVLSSSNPNIQLKVNGTEVATNLFTSSNATGSWVNICGTYIVPTGVTSLEIAIYDKNAGSGAHSYTLDDICFRQTAPPPTPPMIGDFVWNDLNENGIQDAGEPGVNGIVVVLYDVSGTAIMATVTDGKGNYWFSNVPATASGTSYTVGFSSLPAGYIWTIKNAPGATAATNSDVNPSTGRTDPFILHTGEIRNDIDAGIRVSGGPLPIGVSRLQGIYINGITRLNWSTATEINGSNFNIERSTDGVNFSQIGSIPAKGYSSSAVTYNYDDKHVPTGTNYYRLKIVDKDGKYSYSTVVLINAEVKGIHVTGVYPNPFVDKVQMSVVTEGNEMAIVRLMDNVGKVVKQQSTSIPKGLTTLEVSGLDVLQPGLYFLEVRVRDTKQVYKIVK